MPAFGRQLVSVPPPPPLATLKTLTAVRYTLFNSNVENFNLRSRTVGAIAAHIVNYLKLPDVLGLEEIQDDSGVRGASSSS